MRPLGRSPVLRTALVGSTALTAAGVCGHLFLSGAAMALPTDGTVVEGQAEIIYGENSVTIQQGSDRVVIEWQTFDIAGHESVDFIQPSAFAAALNRVLSGAPSQILGSLTANGQVFISNPAGINFGPNANVDVASIVATSLDIMNRDFMESRLDFNIAGDPTAVIENHGAIRASGLAALVGPGARNAGVIVADVTILGGGQGFALDYYGDGLVNFTITDPTTAQPIDADGNPLAALVVNDGTIMSDGGQVILAADAAAGVIDNVINLDGVVMARSIATEGGQVALVGGDEGAVVVAGTIEATGDDDGEEGGTVHVLGDTVVLADGAVIDVSGRAGGGAALIGGDQGGGAHVPTGSLAYLAPAAGGRSGTTIVVDAAFETDGFIPEADIVYAGQGSSVAADAGDAGDGGRVVIWANEGAALFGSVSATGGAQGGDGGFVELSAGQGVAFAGAVNTSAPAGQTGTFLIDPQHILLGTINPAVMFTTIGIDVLAGGNSPLLTVDQQALADTLYTTNVDLWAHQSISTYEDIDVSTANVVVDVVYGGLFSGCFLGCPVIEQRITGYDLTLSAPVVNIGHDMTLGTGALNIVDLDGGVSPLGLGLINTPAGGIQVDTVNLNGTIYARDTVGGATVVAGDDQLNGEAVTVNVLSDAASIQQGIYFADAGATVNVTGGGNTYVENLTIAVEDLKLRGIDDPLLVAADPGDALITVLSSGVNIDPFVLDGNNLVDYGILATGAGALGFISDGNTFRRFNEAGIFVARNGGGTGTIIDNIFEGSATRGVRTGLLSGGYTLNITGNTIGTDGGGEVVNGLLFGQVGTATVVISGGSIDSGGGSGPIDGDAINFTVGLHSGAAVTIDGVDIVSDSDEAVDFHQAVRNGATAEITGGSYVGGNNGVEFDAIAGTVTIADATIDGQGADKRGVNLLGALTGTLEITDSTITGTDDGIGSNDDQDNTINGGTFRVTGSTITGIAGDGIELGVVSNGAIVDILDNPTISGAIHGVNLTGAVAGSTVTISGNNAGIFAGVHGIRFAGPLTDSVVDMDDNIIVAGTTAGANGDGIHFDGPLTDTQVGARDNDIDVGTGATTPNTLHDGIYFGGDIEDHSRVILRGNDIAVAAGGAGSGTSLGDMGIRFDGFIDTNGGDNPDIVIDGNTIQAGTGKEDRGISFWNGIGGQSIVSITDNDIAAGDDGIGVFDVEQFGLGDGFGVHQSLRGDATLVIADNRIGTDGLSVGTASIDDGNGIDFQSVTGASHVVIDGNAIFSDDNGIEFDKVVSTTFSGGLAAVEITNNPVISSDHENGISFESGVLGSTVLIQGNNAGIVAADHGIAFLGAVTGSTLDIHDNIIEANTDENAVGAGVFFAVDVTDAHIDIGDGSLGGAASNIIAVHTNTTNGLGVADLDGILFAGGLGAGAEVLIDGNRIGYAADSLAGPLTLADVADDGVEVRGPVGADASVEITDNRIRARDDGVQFTGVIGGTASIVIGETPTDADGNTIVAGDDGVSFLGAVTGEAVVDINHNRIVAHDDGIAFRGAIQDHAQVLITDHAGWHYGQQRGIFAGGNGIVFGGRVEDHASIVIGGWDGYYPDGNTILAYEHGVVFRQDVTDWASVEISYNLIRGGYRWWDGEFRHSDYDGVRFEDETDNVGHGDHDIAIVGNRIYGSGNGINFLDELDGEHHDVLIGWNAWIEGVHRDGIHLGGGVDEASLRIVHNDRIEGRRDGIDFDDLVQDGAFVLIADNRRILGRHDSGIEFSGVVDWPTDVVIDGNGAIVGGDNGILFQQPDEDLLMTTLVGPGSGGGWAIDQAEVTISDNWLIKGEDENAIWVEGVRGSGYGFQWDNPNLAIVGNHTIWGHDNGILISRVIEFGPVSDLYFGSGYAISGWAVENAEVLIGWNHEIEGHKDDGIQIQGIHTDAGYGGCDCSDVTMASFGGGYWAPSAEVTIVGNGEIEGHDNGINLARGFDLAIYEDGYDGFDVSALSAAVTPSLEAEDDTTVRFSAWAIENADVTIAWNGEIEGEHDDGIFVGGIRSTSGESLDPKGEMLETSGFGGWGGAGASLTIDHNWQIEGHDNGIRLGRGVDVTVYDLDFGFSGPSMMSMAELEVDAIGGLLDDLPDEALVDFGFSAWAIENAEVSITDNHEIRGHEDDGIFVGGIHSTDGGDGPGAMALSDLSGGWGGHGASLTIDGNHRIKGHDNGVNLGRGLNLDVTVSYDFETEDDSAYFLGADIRLNAWAIDGATVRITDNGRIIGQWDNGIRVAGVRDGGDVLSRSLGFGGGYGGWGYAPNLLIADNWAIEGHDNGIELARGVSGGAYAYGNGYDDGYGGTYFSGYGGLFFDAYAIDNATVRILDNHLIEGETDDGIHVGGVRDQGLRMSSALVADGYDGDYDRTELRINGNHLILGGDNGIALDHGFELGLYANVVYDDTGYDTVAMAMLSGPVGALDDGFDLGGFGLSDDDALTITYLDIDGSAIAIYGAEVEIADNGAIIGESENGILVNGLVDEAYDSPETESVEPSLIGGGSGGWNLDIHDNGLIIGKTNGILVDHAYVGHLYFADGYSGPSMLTAGFQAWGIYDANVRIGDNWLIAGLQQDGIQVNGVHGSGVSASSAYLDEDEDSEALGTIVPVATDPSQPNLLIEENTTIVGQRDGIHIGTGFGFEFSGDGEEPPLSDGLATMGSLGYGPGGFGASVEGGLVVIDLNGAADYQAEPEGGLASIGDPYDPEIAVVLSDLDFGFGLFDLGGRVAGVTGDGIDFAGQVHDGSTVQIQRNMLTGSGDNGIEFAGIGEPETLSEGLALVEDEAFGPTSVFIHNNFIVDNGRSLASEEPDEGLTSATLVDSSYVGSGMTVGAGILFEQGVGNVFGSDEESDGGGVEVFQNFIAGNGGPGIQIGFPEEATSEEFLALSYGYGYGDDNDRHYDGVVSADNLSVIHNYLPGGVDEFDDRPNGRFGVANYANDGSAVFAPENWWGTSASAAAVAAQTFGAVDVSPFLATGEDSNEERIPGFTGLGPFAFQPGPTVGPSIEDIFAGFPVDPDLIRFIARGPLSSLDRPGGAQYFTNELGEPYQTNVFGPTYGIGELGDGPGGLQPAAGGQQQDTCEDGDDSCEQGQQTPPQAPQGPINLGNLTPAAGPGSQQVQNADTCVAAFLGDFWGAAAACQ